MWSPTRPRCLLTTIFTPAPPFRFRLSLRSKSAARSWRATSSLNLILFILSRARAIWPSPFIIRYLFVPTRMRSLLCAQYRFLLECPALPARPTRAILTGCLTTMAYSVPCPPFAHCLLGPMKYPKPVSAPTTCTLYMDLWSSPSLFTQLIKSLSW